MAKKELTRKEYEKIKRMDHHSMKSRRSCHLTKGGAYGKERIRINQERV